MTALATEAPPATAPRARRFLGPVERFSRAEFLERRWAYAPGEHVSFLGPTTSGKTTFAYQLLEVTAHPKMPVVALIMKPRDRVVTAWTKELGHRRVRGWPPVPSIFSPRPPGYALWPKHSLSNFERDNLMLQSEFRRAIRQSYRTKARRILFADEVLGLTAELKLGDDLITVWSRGASMDCGLWAATQRPSHVPLHMYSQAHHLFCSYDPDEVSRRRLAEIGGIDPKLVKATVMKLAKYEWLYIRRDGPKICVVDR